MDPSYAEAIGDVLHRCGMQPHEPSGANFDAAYTRKSLLSNLVFLIKDLGQHELRDDFVDQVKQAGRAWCADHVKARWFFREAGLNFVFLHSGQLTPEMVDGQTDSSGFHGAIVQSFTAYDVTTNDAFQEKTWVTIGRVAKALSILARIR